VLGIDDGPFEKGQSGTVPVVAVMMEGADLVESVAVSAFPVDGDGATGFLADWVGSLRSNAALHGVVLGGITLAGLGVVDMPRLALELGLPVLAVTRQDSSTSQLASAVRAAGLPDRLDSIVRAPPSVVIDAGLHAALAGISPADARLLLRATIRKGHMPEPLRLAHLIARALVLGESKGRV
jgi:endonuclease V-like protein UPF0215 family